MHYCDNYFYTNSTCISGEVFSVDTSSRDYKATDILVSIKSPIWHHIKITHILEAFDIEYEVHNA